MRWRIGLLLALLPFAAQAQLALTVHQAPESRINSPRQARTDADRVPGHVSVVTDDNWQDRRASTVKDLLDFTPGVLVQPRNGAEASRLSIRGSGLTRTFQGRGLLLLQDGIPINTADGSFDFQAIDPWTVRYAEVLRGANALTLGASTLGGAVAFTSPTGLDADHMLRTELGSFGHAHSQLAAGARQDAWDIWGSVIDFREEGYRVQNEQRTQRFDSNLGWQGRDVESRMHLSYFDTDEAKIPGTLTRAQLEANPRQANPANLRGNYTRPLENLRLANRTEWRNGEDRWLSTVYYSRRDLQNPATVHLASDTNDWGLRQSYRMPVASGEWLAGLNIAYGTADEERRRNMRGRPGALLVLRDQEALSTEAFLQYDHELDDRLHLLGSAQWSYASRHIDEQFPIIRSQKSHYTGISPRIGMRYELDDSDQFYANLSRSFEPPTLSELSGGNDPGFQSLDEQSATTVELGRAWQSNGLDWDLAYYHSWVEGEFITYRFADGSTSTLNAGRSTRDGVELGVGGKLTESWLAEHDALTLQFAYAWSYFQLRSDPVFGSNRLAGAPEHLMQARLLYAHPSGITAGPTLEWVPKGYDIDLANSYQTRPYALLGFTASYALEEMGLRLSLEARNLTDETYAATTGVIPNADGRDQNQFYPGEGRALYAGLEWRW